MRPPDKLALKDCKKGTAFKAPESGVVIGPKAGGVAVLIRRRVGNRAGWKDYPETWSGFIRVEVQ